MPPESAMPLPDPVLVTVTEATEDAPVVTRLLSWSRISTSGWMAKSIPERDVSAELTIANFTAAPWVRSIVWVMSDSPVVE